MTKFNMNDIVKIVDNRCYHKFSIGELVFIVGVYDVYSGTYYDAESIDGMRFWCITNNCAELIKGE